HKHKHKHHREQTESSSHSHKKVTGKRTTRDSSNDESDKNGDLLKEYDSKSSHVRKKAKRHHDDINEKVEINGEHRSIETCGDSVKRHVIDKTKKTEKRLTSKSNMNKSYTSNTDKGLIGDSVGKRSTDVDYMSIRDKKGKTSLKGVVKKVKVEKSQTLNDVKNKEILHHDNNGGNLVNYEGENLVKSEIDEKYTLDDDIIKGINHDSKESLMSELAINTSTYSLREKRSYPPVTEDTKTKIDERSSSKSVNTKSFCQSKGETSAEITSNTIDVTSSISNESQPSIPPSQETTKAITSDLNETSSGIINSDLVTKEDTNMSKSVGKKGPARKLGRPPKLQEPQRKATPRTWTWQKKKKDLKTILTKLLDSFTKKDAYEKKIERNEYSSIDEFKEDFALVCNNCKTYNAPETLYYKSADKLWQFGDKAIERERDSILLEEERMKALGVESGKRAANVAQGVASSRATSISKPGRQVRKQRRGEARKQFAPDGSLIHSNIPFI
ncbi:12484_t:CDS:2, partial [Dentiscutata erythropus]